MGKIYEKKIIQFGLFLIIVVAWTTLHMKITSIKTIFEKADANTLYNMINTELIPSINIIYMAGIILFTIAIGIYIICIYQMNMNKNNK